MAIDGFFYLPLHHTTCIFSLPVRGGPAAHLLGGPTYRNQHSIFHQAPKTTQYYVCFEAENITAGVEWGGGGRQSKKIKKIWCGAGAILLGKKVRRWHPHVTNPTVGILTSSHTNTTEKVNIRIKLRFTGHIHIHSQHSLSTTQKIHIYRSSAYLCIQMIDRSHDNIHT